MQPCISSSTPPILSNHCLFLPRMSLAIPMAQTIREILQVLQQGLLSTAGASRGPLSFDPGEFFLWWLGGCFPNQTKGCVTISSTRKMQFKHCWDYLFEASAALDVHFSSKIILGKIPVPKKDFRDEILEGQPKLTKNILDIIIMYISI